MDDFFFILCSIRTGLPSDFSPKIEFLRTQTVLQHSNQAVPIEVLFHALKRYPELNWFNRNLKYLYEKGTILLNILIT
jgi:hypothetical protein